MPRVSRWCLIACLSLGAACDHPAPFSTPAPIQVGPFGSVTPRRLTFFEGQDATPSVTGGQLYFSRQSADEPGAYAAAGREQCITIMPVEGGTITRSLCPRDYITQPDTFVDTWFEPSLSPDGKRLAYVWQRGLRVSALGFSDVFLMVTAPDLPADTNAVRYTVQWTQDRQPNPVRATMATRIRWEDPAHLLFLATYEHIRKVKGGGAERVTDTTFDPLALMRLDVSAATAALVPGGDSVQAYARAPDGGLWVIKQADSSALMHLDPVSGQLAFVARFSRPVTDLANVADLPVAITRDSTAIEWVDATGQVVSMSGFGGLLHRLAPAGGRKFVIEVEDGYQLFGRPPDLWLLELP